MIIECINCKKEFNIDSDLIPDEGRLLECGSCNHRWFFKNTDKFDDDQKPKPQSLFSQEIDSNNIDKTINNIEKKKEGIKKISKTKIKVSSSFKINRIKKEGTNILNLIIVFIISFTALIILTDTFKSVIKKIIPNIEFMLYNLYESIKDIILFYKDLI
jgi:predicted Zn finger-like uncharacterized protein|tara:strand:- start:1993 stop:2469 length:477 start_codon:yes stop_codon:yes gene_type:complete